MMKNLNSLRTAVYWHGACYEHKIPNHPEQPRRIEAILSSLRKEIVDPNLSFRDSKPATDEHILHFHTREHLEKFKLLHAKTMDDFRRKRKVTYRDIDGDTKIMWQTKDAAYCAVGAVINALDDMYAPSSDVTTGTAPGSACPENVDTAFCGVRPPGHHAERNKMCGFCFFNNVAIGARYAQKKYGVKRVAVLDFDVHHGNGTEEGFTPDDSLFYGSTHARDHFPGSGPDPSPYVGPRARKEQDRRIVNRQLPHGAASRRQFRAKWLEILVEMERFGPDLVIISAGFDAHRADPLAECGLESEDFAWATTQVLNSCARIPRHRLQKTQQLQLQPSPLQSQSQLTQQQQLDSAADIQVEPQQQEGQALVDMQPLNIALDEATATSAPPALVSAPHSGAGSGSGPGSGPGSYVSAPCSGAGSGSGPGSLVSAPCSGAGSGSVGEPQVECEMDYPPPIPCLSVLEGGYNLQAIQVCAVAHVRALMRGAEDPLPASPTAAAVLRTTATEGVTAITSPASSPATATPGGAVKGAVAISDIVALCSLAATESLLQEREDMIMRSRTSTAPAVAPRGRGNKIVVEKKKRQKDKIGIKKDQQGKGVSNGVAATDADSGGEGVVAAQQRACSIAAAAAHSPEKEKEKDLSMVNEGRITLVSNLPSLTAEGLVGSADDAAAAAEYSTAADPSTTVSYEEELGISSCTSSAKRDGGVAADSCDVSPSPHGGDELAALRAFMSSLGLDDCISGSGSGSGSGSSSKFIL